MLWPPLPRPPRPPPPEPESDQATLPVTSWRGSQAAVQRRPSAQQMVLTELTAVTHRDRRGGSAETSPRGQGGFGPLDPRPGTGAELGDSPLPLRCHWLVAALSFHNSVRGGFFSNAIMDSEGKNSRAAADGLRYQGGGGGLLLGLCRTVVSRAPRATLTDHVVGRGRKLSVPQARKPRSAKGRFGGFQKGFVHLGTLFCRTACCFSRCSAKPQCKQSKAVQTPTCEKGGQTHVVRVYTTLSSTREGMCANVIKTVTCCCNTEYDVKG